MSNATIAPQISAEVIAEAQQKADYYKAPFIIYYYAPKAHYRWMSENSWNTLNAEEIKLVTKRAIVYPWIEN